MTTPNSINVQSSLVLARCATDGAGGILTPIPQQGVSGTGWTFTGATPATGQIRLNLASQMPAVGGVTVGMFLATANNASNGLICRVNEVSATQIQVTVTDETGGAVNLSTTAVDIRVIGGTPS